MSHEEQDRQERETQRQRYLDGEMDAAERQRFEEELLASDAEAEEIFAELNLRKLEEERRRRRGRRRRIPRRMVIWPAAMAAAAALVLWLQTPVPQDDTPVFRDVSGSLIQSLEPAGQLTELPRRFVWTAVAAADSYRFELYDGDSRRQLSRTTADTLVQLSDSQRAPATGYWVVVGVDDVGVPLGEPQTTWYDAPASDAGGADQPRE